MDLGLLRDLRRERFGLTHARCAIPPNTLRLMILHAHPLGYKPTRIVHSAPVAASCPTYGEPMRVVMRLWTVNRAFVDTG
ncbi:MAG TPA: hypothetical protein VI542_39305 [Candidatus Tectomicrobia bacterium]